MRIAIMMRSADEAGGIGVYARNIVEELLKLDHDNEYVLFYKSEKHLGSYSKFTNCREVLLPGKNKAIWDQLTIPRAARHEKIDLIFNPKFTVPLFTRCKTVMVVHGADWFVPPYDEVYTTLDNFYIKRVMPLYFRKADYISSVSDYSTDCFVNAFPWCKKKIKTIYFGPNKIFKPVSDKQALGIVRSKYNLPEMFILTVIRYDPGTRNTRKNFKRMAEAYSLYKKMGGKEKFVVVGRDCHRYGEEHDLKALGIQDDLVFPGLVPQEDLPAFYSLAKLYLYPTIIEAFPIPTTEAMACGCPIVTSKGTGLEELTHGVSVAVDPLDSQAIANAMKKVLNDEGLQQEMREKGFERSKIFSWEKCAVETLEIFQNLMAEN
ncbi:MAG: glycosyltransferase family 4 protein [Proteobacteria bacterium]|jgi:glycosyltransferase involved in cell wall biosynthesis|nr:glycosyltransferase family 4 protein [Desulfocapsa sp.]MBU3946021.1 glycosyltransferase family 4 protein [Pseudomonadota bacterium]MCG2742855.1 glycosyltransferase family 4 protein [Desulfobacteraceae bacterium]MBU4030170.1 glycosyltransferase family 4 protein [Pseudomonadota bacterium]MBU4043794.1 glycosyltransferase family 4 protein [Pseudomonadota bacterium]